MTTRITTIALIVTTMIATGAGVAHAQRGGHGGFVGRPGGGSPRPSGGSPSFSRPTSNPSANGFSRPANSSSLGERPSFGGIGNTNRLNPSGNLVGQRPPATTRPSAGDGLGVAGRPGAVNVGNTVVNRTAIGGNTVVNRTVNQNITNNNVTNVVNRNVVNRNVVNRNVTAINRPGYGYGGYRPGYGYGGGFRPGYGYGGWGYGYGGGFRPNPYLAYHQGWVNGYWNGNYNSGWGYGGFGNSALGWGIGIGVAAWGIGSLFNSWGYSSYMNPYYSSPMMVAQQPAFAAGQPLGAAQPVAYDYSRPINLQSPPPPENVANQAVALFDSARAAFRGGDYVRALNLGDQAVQQMPNDPMIHEFRAFCLFALGRYDEAAVPLYTVLSAGPGWDWTTLVHLYSNVDVYTAQLRALESYCAATPKAASARFLLAAMYMTQGGNDAAAARFRDVVALQPQDRLSAQLADALTAKPQAQATAALTGPSENPARSDQPPPNPTPAQAPNAPPGAEGPPLPAGPVPGKLVGAWSASPVKDVNITLAITDDKSFKWKVNDRGQSREFQGVATFDNDTLALSAADQPPMVGTVAWKDDGNFLFKALGAPPADPGLTFGK